jgi:hypothetical protein
MTALAADEAHGAGGPNLDVWIRFTGRPDEMSLGEVWSALWADEALRGPSSTGSFEEAEASVPWPSGADLLADGRGVFVQARVGALEVPGGQFARLSVGARLVEWGRGTEWLLSLSVSARALTTLTGERWPFMHMDVDMATRPAVCALHEAFVQFLLRLRERIAFRSAEVREETWSGLTAEQSAALPAGAIVVLRTFAPAGAPVGNHDFVAL